MKIEKTYRLGRFDDPKTMTDVEAAYWAAIIDGEGSICITRATVKDQNRPQYRLVLNVTNTNLDLLDRLGRMVGVGNMTKGHRSNEKWKDKGQLIMNSEAADFVIRQCYPHLIAKREQAEVALDFMHLKRSWTRSNDNHEAQAELYAKSRALNARGKVNQKPFSFTRAAPAPVRTCERDDCAEKHYGNGLCRKHYRWAYESKTWTPESDRKCKGCGGDLPTTLNLSAKFCSTACKMKHHRAKGCYSPEAQADAPRCSEEGCERPRQAQGLCRRHYMQRWHAARKYSEVEGS